MQVSEIGRSVHMSLFFFHSLMSIVCSCILMISLTFLRAMLHVSHSYLPQQGFWSLCICLCSYSSIRLAPLSFGSVHLEFAVHLRVPRHHLYQTLHWFHKLHEFFWHIWSPEHQPYLSHTLLNRPPPLSNTNANTLIDFPCVPFFTVWSQ